MAKRTSAPKCKGSNKLCGMKCQPPQWKCKSAVSTGAFSTTASVVGNALTPPQSSTPTPTPPVVPVVINQDDDSNNTTSQVAPIPSIPPVVPPVIKTNQSKIDDEEARLIKRYGASTIQQVNDKLKDVLNDDDEVGVYQRRRDLKSLEGILDEGKVKNAYEVGKTSHNVPMLQDFNYLNARERVENLTMGYEDGDDKNNRPIYAYLASNYDMNSSSHNDVNLWGDIIIKYKSSVKDRATFTGADSFKSGYASSVRNPSVASIVPATRHGYDVADLSPRNYPSYYRQTIDDFIPVLAKISLNVDSLVRNIDNQTPGNKYLEVQVHNTDGKSALSADEIESVQIPLAGSKLASNLSLAQKLKDRGIKVIDANTKKEVDLDGILNPKPVVNTTTTAPDPNDPVTLLRNTIAKNVTDLINGTGTYEQAMELHNFAEIVDKNFTDSEILNTHGPNNLLATLKALGYWDTESKVASSDKSLGELKSMVDADPSRYSLAFRAVSDDPYSKTKAQDIFDDFKQGNSQGRGLYGNGHYFAGTSTKKGKAPDDTAISDAQSDSEDYGSMQWGAVIDTSNSIDNNKLLQQKFTLIDNLTNSLASTAASTTHTTPVGWDTLTSAGSTAMLMRGKGRSLPKTVLTKGTSGDEFISVVEPRSIKNSAVEVKLQKVAGGYNLDTDHDDYKPIVGQFFKTKKAAREALFNLHFNTLAQNESTKKSLTGSERLTISRTLLSDESILAVLLGKDVIVTDINCGINKDYVYMIVLNRRAVHTTPDMWVSRNPPSWHV